MFASQLIPDAVFVPLLCACVALMFLDMILQFCGVRWLYSLGPCVRRHRWQSTLNRNQLNLALSRLGQPARMKLHFQDGWVGVREEATGTGYFRASIRLAPDSGDGAAVVYEQRLALSLLFAYAGLAVLILAGLTMKSFLHVWTIGAIVVGIAFNITFLYQSNRLFGVASPLAPQFAQLGLKVCESCGYDLHLATSPSRCPECGAPH